MKFFNIWPLEKKYLELFIYECNKLNYDALVLCVDIPAVGNRKGPLTNINNDMFQVFSVV